jgi:hypothetical protein
VPAANDKAAPGKRKGDAPPPDWTERIIYLVVVSVIAAVPLLAFAFSYGNVGALGMSFGISRRIAYLTGPAVDLSVVGLIVAGSYLSYKGWAERDLLPIHLFSVLCGMAMIALNCGQAVYESHWRLASFDAVGPLLLIGWGFIGPWLLRQLADARSDGSARKASSRKAATNGSTSDRKPETETAAATAPSTASPASAGTGSLAGSPPPSTGKPSPAKANGTAAGNRNGSGPIPIKRADRLALIRDLIDDAGGDPAKLPLKVIKQRFGVSDATASRMRTDAAETPPAAAPAVPEDEPERALAVNS